MPQVNVSDYTSELTESYNQYPTIGSFIDLIKYAFSSTLEDGSLRLTYFDFLKKYRDNPSNKLLDAFSSLFWNYESSSEEDKIDKDLEKLKDLFETNTTSKSFFKNLDETKLIWLLSICNSTEDIIRLCNHKTFIEIMGLFDDYHLRLLYLLSDSIDEILFIYINNFKSISSILNLLFNNPIDVIDIYSNENFKNICKKFYGELYRNILIELILLFSSNPKGFKRMLDDDEVIKTLMEKDVFTLKTIIFQSKDFKDFLNKISESNPSRAKLKPYEPFKKLFNLFS